MELRGKEQQESFEKAQQGSSLETARLGAMGVGEKSSGEE